MGRAKTATDRGQEVVLGEIRVYPIEPARFGLGLSRVQMCDRHIAQLATEGKTGHVDVDHLLAARARYTQEAPR